MKRRHYELTWLTTYQHTHRFEAENNDQARRVALDLLNLMLKADDPRHLVTHVRLHRIKRKQIEL